jgi:hypothetical protein
MLGRPVRLLQIPFAFGTWNIGTTFWLRLSHGFYYYALVPQVVARIRGGFARKSRPARMAADATGLGHSAIRVPGKLSIDQRTGK